MRLTIHESYCFRYALDPQCSTTTELTVSDWEIEVYRLIYMFSPQGIARGLYKYNRPKWFRLSSQVQALKEEIVDVMKSSGSSGRRFGEVYVFLVYLCTSIFTPCTQL